MKKKSTAFMLALTILIGQVLSSSMAVFAADGKNLNGHTITYKPIEKLYTNNEVVKFFSADSDNEWGTNVIGDIRNYEASSIAWLSQENYLLNHFGRKEDVEDNNFYGPFNSRGEWQTKMTGNRNAGRWYGDVVFDALSGGESMENGNIYNMYKKGDLEYFFSCNVFTVQTSWWGEAGASNDTGLLSIFGVTEPKFIGGGWKPYNRIASGGPYLTNPFAWKSASKFDGIRFMTDSNKDSQVDSYMSGAILVGRDVKGPRIDSVKMTADVNGRDTIENGVVTLDTINNKLTDRTVYFHVQWDEPVIFKGLSENEIAKLELTIQTMGEKSGSLPASARFLKFEPLKTDTKPIMVFEYRIPDPYGPDVAAQKRGYTYTFQDVTVSANENSFFWDHIYDLSGNKYASIRKIQYNEKISTAISGSARVDLQPLGISKEGLKITNSFNEGEVYLKGGDELLIDLYLNKKPIRIEPFPGWYPEITLNLKRHGSYMTARPINYDRDGGLISYKIDIPKDQGLTLDGDYIKVIEVDSGYCKDNSGYNLMNYALNDAGVLSPTNFPVSNPSDRIKEDYRVSPNKQYKIDFEPPVIDLTAVEEDGIVRIETLIDDATVAGMDASFTVKVNGNAEENATLSYQASGSGGYNLNNWKNGEPGKLSVTFSGPISTLSGDNTVYGYVKLPNNCETDNIDISVTVADKIGNSATAERNISANYDKLAPSVETSVNYEKINVLISDIDNNVEYMYGYSDNHYDEPTYTTVSGNEGVIPAPNLPSDGQIHTRVVWIKAKDSKGNIGQALKIPMRYDRTLTSIDYTADTDRLYVEGDYPTAQASIENTYCYWYMWAEKPAGEIDLAGFIEDAYLVDFKSRAENLGQVFRPSDDDPSSQQPNNVSNPTITLTANTDIVGIDSSDESYGDNVRPNETTRPLILVLAAERYDDGNPNPTTLVRTLEFNTVYAAPKIEVNQSRFSTNNQVGKRLDYIRRNDGTGLVWPNDSQYIDHPLNTHCLYGFAQTEFTLVGDPVTGLDRVDISKSSISLQKVLYSGENIKDGVERGRELVAKWNLSDLELNNSAMGNKNVIIDIDSSSIKPGYYEIDGEGNRLAVRYEFVSELGYIGGVDSSERLVSYHAFNNMPRAFIHSTAYPYSSHYSSGYFTGSYMDKYIKRNVEAIFDQYGNDITGNIPLYSISTGYSDVYGSLDHISHIRFSTLGESNYDTYEEYLTESDKAYYSAPVQNPVNSNNTAKLAVRIGTNPNNLSAPLPFESQLFGVWSEPYDISQYLFNDANEFREVTLYYQFEDLETASSSPIYVFKLRRDNMGPLFNLNVSETTNMTSEVLVKFNGVNDFQTAPDGTLVIDTPESVLCSGENYIFGAWRVATKYDDLDSIPEEDKIEEFDYYDDETGEYFYKTYIKVNPEEDGFYHFTSKGYIEMRARDYAANWNTGVLVNGELVNLSNERPLYYINNVDSEPPTFVNQPVFSENDGSFQVTAKVDDTVKNVYLRFDNEYSVLLSGERSENNSRYNIKNVPGIFSGGYDEGSGEINAEIYVKYSESTPLSSLALVLEDESGNETEYTYSFTSPIYGKNTEIINPKNANGYPVYSYGAPLNFSLPVKLEGIDGDYKFSHENIAVYSDGVKQIGYIDLFGDSKIEDIYVNIFEGAFAHDWTFTANGEKIKENDIVSADVTVTIDTSKTPNLYLEGGGTKLERTFTENGMLTYTLINTDWDETRTYDIPIGNIDKTAPEAYVTFIGESERDIESGEVYFYSVTYSVDGFNEDGVSLISSEGGIAPSSVTFDYDSTETSYTFRFRDRAGNEGSYRVDASDIVFAQRSDKIITDYRLTYTIPYQMGFRIIGEFGRNETVSGMGLVNKAVSVKIEALNQNGEVVPSVISLNGSLPEGASIYEKEKMVMFTSESDEERLVSLTLTGTGDNNSISLPVILPANTIDLTAPTGTVFYKAEGNIVKAFLETKDKDLADNGIYVTGTKIDGTEFELKNDGDRYYTELDKNGVGKFVLIDKAGNTGTVPIAVLDIDSEAPEILAEGWQSVMDVSWLGVIDENTKRQLDDLLATPTNSSIKVFITFNEQLSRTEVEAYTNGEDSEKLLPTEDYIIAVTSGSTLTVEFKENCRAKLTVYDLRGNALTLWRPEDGPITAIDRNIPKLVVGYPKMTKDNNIVTLEYVFADGEEVMLLQNHEAGYKNSHIVSFSENGSQILNFADRAGNVFSDYPIISGIDELGPNIKISLDFVGEGEELSGDDSYKAGNLYTNRNVRVLLNVTDETNDGITVSAKTKSGTSLDVKEETIESNNKSYNFNVVVSENGSYQILAKDKWGNESPLETNISIIDRTGPTIKISGSTVIVEEGSSKNELISKLLENVSAEDLQSGANSPLGDHFGAVTDGVTLSAGLGDVNLNKAGIYNGIISAVDRLGNTSEKERRVFVVKDLYVFKINGSSAYAGDVFITPIGKIRIQDANETTKYYYAQGYMTKAQMKYGKGFDPEIGFDALQKGYYTILAQDSDRKMHLLYVSVQ